jgi:putative glutamine amidotransferase
MVYHHQAIDSVGAGLTVAALSADNVIEAIEIDDYPFGVAVQWHPEVTSTRDGRLFEALAAAATNYRRSA